MKSKGVVNITMYTVPNFMRIYQIYYGGSTMTESASVAKNGNCVIVVETFICV